MLRTRLVLAALGTATVACAPKPAPESAGADTTAAPAAAVPDTTTRDSLVRDTAAAAASTTKDSVKTSGTKSSPYIGHDSAYGPKFTIDSTGKITPIAPATKKP